MEVYLYMKYYIILYIYVCFPRSLFSPKFDEPEQCSKYPVLHRFPRSSWSCGECNRGHPRTMSPMFKGYNLYDPPTVNLSKFTTAPGSIKQTWWFWCDLMWFVSLLLKVSLPKWWGWPITEQSLTKVSKWSSICRLVVFFSTHPQTYGCLMSILPHPAACFGLTTWKYVWKQSPASKIPKRKIQLLYQCKCSGRSCLKLWSFQIFPWLKLKPQFRIREIYGCQCPIKFP